MGFPDHLFYDQFRGSWTESIDYGYGAGILVRSVAETVVSPTNGGLPAGLDSSSLFNGGLRMAGLSATEFGRTEVRPAVLDGPVGSAPAVDRPLFLPPSDRRGAVGKPGALVFHRFFCDRRLECRPGRFHPVSALLGLDHFHRIVESGYLVAELINQFVGHPPCHLMIHHLPALSDISYKNRRREKSVAYLYS